MVEATRVHPALPRFLRWTDPESRLLLVRAAPETGRIWFAKSWMGDRKGAVHDFSERPFEVLEELEKISLLLARDPQLHAAVVLAPGHTVWHLALTAKFLFAQQRDLLLDQAEIAAMHGGGDGSGKAAAAIYSSCGGWLGAVQLLVRDPRLADPARQKLRAALATWLAHHDPERSLSEASVLPAFDQSTVKIFYCHFRSDPHTLNDLVHAGLVQEHPEQGWLMPSMVRALLLERIQTAGAQRMELLEEASLEAVASVHGLLATADAAIEQQRWSVLNRLVTGHWDELFVLDLEKFSELARRIPPFIAGKNTYFGLGLRILDEFTGNDSGLQAPHLAIDYQKDQLAQALRQEADRHYLYPDAWAVSIGLLEMLYLRINGMYVQSGEAALRMRNALHKAYAANEVRPALASLAHAQAGNSLFMAGLGTEAQQSYELALATARRTGSAYLLSGAAGKLALLHALEGNAAAAAGYLSEHQQHFAQVSRNQARVDREAILASACLSLRKLDAELVRFELSKLPGTPDMNELWPVHAYLLAAEKIILGLPSAAGKLIHQLRRQREASARAPLARELLDDILAAIALLERSHRSEGFDRSALDPALLAVQNLADGDPDAAMAQLRNGSEPMGLRVGSNLAKYAEIIARSADGPTEESIAMIRAIHEDSGGLY